MYKHCGYAYTEVRAEHVAQEELHTYILNKVRVGTPYSMGKYFCPLIMYIIYDLRLYQTTGYQIKWLTVNIKRSIAVVKVIGCYKVRQRCRLTLFNVSLSWSLIIFLIVRRVLGGSLAYSRILGHTYWRVAWGNTSVTRPRSQASFAVSW